MAEENGEAEALILKDKSLDSDVEAIYEIVDQEDELELVAKIFKEVLGDIDFDME